ncbi:MAG: polysaccharide biosynthesis tyrosine autokinase [Thermoguttaceae bacterium]
MRLMTHATMESRTPPKKLFSNPSMMQQPSVSSVDPQNEPEFQSFAQLAHVLFRLLLAVRYRKNLVLAVMTAAILLGTAYYVTVKRQYASKAALLISQAGGDRLDPSITSGELQRQNVMPTFESMVRSAKVLEGALKELTPADCVDRHGESREFSVETLRENLSAKAIRSTSILEVSFTSTDPQISANVVRAVVQSYLNLMDGIHRGTAGEISRMLTKEREELAGKLSAKQAELLGCRRQFADMGFRADTKTLHPTVQRAVYFNDALVAAQKERVENEALLAGVETAVANGANLGPYLVAVLQGAGQEWMLNSLGLGANDIVTQANLQRDLIATKTALETAQQNLGPRHPEVVALAEKVRLTDQFLRDAQLKIGQNLSGGRQLGPWLTQMARQKLEESRTREGKLQKCFEETRAEAINLSGQLAQVEMLERDVKRLGDLNDVLLNQIASLDLRQNGSDVRVAVIEEAVVKESPVWPRLPVVVVTTMMLGFGLAIGLVTLLDALDDRFRSIDEMQARLGLPLLSMIQQLQPPESTGPMALVAHALPMSTESEGFRTLRTALALTQPDASRLVVTSTEPGDGKTTTLANLAVCYAQGDKRTLLIDADLRRPGLTHLMNMRGPRGLSEVLRSDADIAQMAPLHVRASGVRGLDILPSGARPNDPAELLGSPRFSQLLAWAETMYDVVLIDSPPLMATADTAIVGRLVDGVILVVQPAKNHRRLVTRVVERLNLMKIPVFGLVINRTGSESEYRYYGYHEYGYRYDYGEGYGGDVPVSRQDTDREGCVSLVGRADDVDESRARVVPRRVA